MYNSVIGKGVLSEHYSPRFSRRSFMADNEHKTIITPRQITSPRISAGVNRCPESATPTVFFGHIRVHRPRLVFRDIKYILDDRSSWRSRWKREPSSSSVVAEDNKEAKEGDGKRANGIDEKERIMTGKVACGGIMRLSTMPSLCVRFIATVASCQRRFPFAVPSQLQSSGFEPTRGQAQGIIT